MNRVNSGMTIAETVAFMSVMLPILMAVILVLAELSHVYVIRQGLLHAARQAARSMVAIYDESPIIAKNRSIQDSLVYSHVKIKDIVNSSNQFDFASFDQSSTPAKVTVKVQYTSGQNGLAKFPIFDPLNLGSYQMSETATYAVY
ncbi:MAG: pilus assembly protein [Candidatus Obscuribacterales bacterium]|nr:pilus assembly protein [Candidatus Obscuribacterales bacterium]